MALVRAVIGDQEVNVSPEFAESEGLEVLNESAYRSDGRVRPSTRRDGRAEKPKTSVAKAAEKKAAQSADNNPPSPKEK